MSPFSPSRKYRPARHVISHHKSAQAREETAGALDPASTHRMGSVATRHRAPDTKEGTMGKRAILQITPAKKDDGSDYNLFLSLGEDQTTDGTEWTWWLPLHFGRGPNDMGIFTKSVVDLKTVYCDTSDGSKDLIKIQGVVPRTLGEFPFKPEDLVNHLKGNLVVLVDNYYLKTGTYQWALYDARI